MTAQRQSLPPVLQSETAGITPLRPLKAHDLLLLSDRGGVQIIDGDTTKLLGTIYTSQYANVAIAPDDRTFYVAETYWSRGNRGTREDLLSIYERPDLKLAAEITLPGRLISDPKTHVFDLSADGRYAYVYNFQPASSVVVVDLHARKVVGSVEVPGCGLVYPWGARGFASICADGSLATADVNATGEYSLERTHKFFDIDNDPIFDESVVDRHTGRGFFLSYTGLLYEAQLGREAKISSPWSIQEAAGLSRATTRVGDITWRPTGSVLVTYHRASARLFVLMHEGPHWDYEKPGTEIWVLDVRQRKVLARLTVPEAASILAVTQDERPILFAISDEWLWVLDPNTGTVLRATEVRGPALVAVRDL
jgi:methylamine dehydrogenase heavy chain